MNECERIADQIHRSYAGNAWHGPGLKEVLDGVTAERAATRPIASTHSIWEIVLHVNAWVREALETVRGKKYESLKGDRDWPPVSDTSVDAWQHALSTLAENCAALVNVIKEFPPEKLGEGDRSIYALMHGIVQHNAYHGGQIALLKKS